MKKILALLFAVIMCVSIVSCNTEGSKKGNSSESSSSKSTDKKTEETTGNRPQDKVLTWDELKSAVTIIDLTLDNWEEYFEICEIEEIKPADFEDEEPEIKRDLYVKLKSENTYAADIVMRFSYREAITHNKYDALTKEQISSVPDASYRNSEDTLKDDSLSYQGFLGTIGSLGTCTYNRYQYNGVIYETILDVKDIECVKVQGKIILLNLPDDAWNNTRYGGGKFYILYEKDGQKFTIMKEGMADTLRKLFVSEN